TTYIRSSSRSSLHLFFFTAHAPPEIYTLSLHDALPIFVCQSLFVGPHQRTRGETDDAGHRGTRTVLEVVGTMGRHPSSVWRRRGRSTPRDDRRPTHARGTRLGKTLEAAEFGWLCRSSRRPHREPGDPTGGGRPARDLRERLASRRGRQRRRA